MISVGLARRYARALLSLSERRKDVDQTNQELHVLAALFQRDVRVRRFFETPNIARVEKLAFLEKEWRPKVGPTMYGLLMVLLRRRRLDHLVVIAEEFQKLSEQSQGVVRATVTSAVPFSDAQATRLAEALGRRSGLKVVLTREVDPAVIGGAVVSMDQKVIDGTLATAFWRIRRQLLQARVKG